jgi:type I restriction enzyme S subunit
LYHVLADENFFEYNMQHAKGAKMPRGNKAKIMEYSFRIPKDLAEQECIVSILDKFDTLTSSISEGLPFIILSVRWTTRTSPFVPPARSACHIFFK